MFREKSDHVLCTPKQLIIAPVPVPPTIIVDEESDYISIVSRLLEKAEADITFTSPILSSSEIEKLQHFSKLKNYLVEIDSISNKIRIYKDTSSANSAQGSQDT